MFAAQLWKETSMSKGPIIFVLAIMGVLQAGCGHQAASSGSTTAPAGAGSSTTAGSDASTTAPADSGRTQLIVGGRAQYNHYAGTATITRVEKTEASNAHEGMAAEGYEVWYTFVPK